MLSGGQGRHAGLPMAQSGAPLDDADGALVLVHGRGGDAAGMLELARGLAGRRIACLAPQAAGQVWYPRRFVEPNSVNEPDLSSALSVLDDLIERLAARMPPLRVVLLGFSQGACLAAECLRRRARPLGGLIVLSGGLIGETPGAGAGGLDGTPVLLACSEHDPHIPATRVRETQAVFSGMGAEVTLQLYPGDSHTVTAEEVARARRLLGERLGAAGRPRPAAPAGGGGGGGARSGGLARGGAGRVRGRATQGGSA